MSITDLEHRLRRGLDEAAHALPATSAEPALHSESQAPGLSYASPPRRRGWFVPVGAAAAVLAVVVAAVLIVGQKNDDSAGDVSVQPQPSDSTTSTTPDASGTPQPANGMVPGLAMLGLGHTPELRTFGPDGEQTGTITLDPPLKDLVQAASSDLNGGWVACGSDTAGIPTEENPATDLLVWYPVDRDPVVFDLHGRTNIPVCSEQLRVVDSPDGPAVVYMGDPLMESPQFRMIVLSTGEQRDLDIPITSDSTVVRWSAATGKLVIASSNGWELYDLQTFEAQPLPTSLPTPGPGLIDIALAPDASSVAVITGDSVDAPIDLAVHSLADGAELYRKTFELSPEGVQLSYDGTTVAVGSFYDGNGPVTVINLGSGAHRTIETWGGLL